MSTHAAAVTGALLAADGRRDEDDVCHPFHAIDRNSTQSRGQAPPEQQRATMPGRGSCHGILSRFLAHDREILAEFDNPEDAELALEELAASEGDLSMR